MSYAPRFARTTARSIEQGKKQTEINRKAEAWRAAHPAAAAWIRSHQDDFSFADSLSSYLSRKGELTPNQLAAVERAIERDAAREAERVQRAVAAPEVDTKAVEIAFAHAQDKGVKKPKMTLDGLKISMAPAHGVNAGALYVVRKADDQYLGKIKDGRFQAVRECSADEAAAVARVVSDPKAEAIAYGQRTGNCCICNRELTNHAGIDLGIGPICAEKFGW